MYIYVTFEEASIVSIKGRPNTSERMLKRPNDPLRMNAPAGKEWGDDDGRNRHPRRLRTWRRYIANKTQFPRSLPSQQMISMSA